MLSTDHADCFSSLEIAVCAMLFCKSIYVRDNFVIFYKFNVNEHAKPEPVFLPMSHFDFMCFVYIGLVLGPDALQLPKLWASVIHFIFFLGLL